MRFFQYIFIILGLSSTSMIYAQLNINASVTQNATCYDFGDGEITLNITSGTAPFTIEFFLYDGAEVPIATINATSDLSIVLNDNIVVSTGSVNYTSPFPGFGIKANQNIEDAGLLGSNEYRVRVISSDGGFNNKSVTGLIVTEPNQITLDAAPSISDNTTCQVGLTNGSIDITFSGGTGPFSFDWSGPNGFTAITEDISGLAGGDYSVTITDDFTTGCSETFGPFTINDPSPNDYSIQSSGSRDVCDGDGTDIVLLGSDLAVAPEPDVIYTIWIDNGTNNPVACADCVETGTGGNLTFSLTSSDISDGDIITIVAEQGDCADRIMTGSVVIDITPLPSGTIS
ncbi:SprB repeat-containing protein, partial [Fulvivirga lutimaris]|uniref:SprB repeat-containing protein n=1 Tax=Fulvivirga lutimaris TaxID=1819566 RepID=UPI0012BCCE68